jgi:RHS repeat-associated protein
LSVETAPDGTQTRTSYQWCDETCPSPAVYYVIIQTDGEAPVYHYYDSLQREVRKRTLGLDGKIILEDTVYNPHGEVQKSSNPYYAGAPALWTRYTYDILQRLKMMELPDGSKTTMTYQGLSTTTVNGKGQSKTEVKNALGEKIKVIDAEEHITHYFYDAAERLIAIEDAMGHRITMAYDLLDQQIQVDDPDKGRVQYVYNPLGKVYQTIDNSGRISRVSYDKLGRPLSKIEDAAGAQPVVASWTYDKDSHGIGQLFSASSAGFQEIHAYDALGRPWKTTTTVSGQPYVVTKTYDAHSRLQDLTYPSGLTVRHGYNERGYLVALGNAATKKQYWQLAQMDAEGNIEAFQLGNGAQTKQSFNPQTGHVKQIVSQKGQKPLQSMAFDFDVLGNLMQRKDKLNGTSESFEYDALNRLVQAKDSVDHVVTTQYDPLGNIISRSDVGTYSYGGACVMATVKGAIAGPHAVSAIKGNKTASYCYDANGNRIADDGKLLYYTAFNLPYKIVKGQHIVEFAYGPEQERYQQRETGPGGLSITTYIDGIYERVEKGNALEHKHYIGDHALVITSAMGPSREQYLHRDHLGSLVAISDALGNVIEQLSFDPWGQRVEPKTLDALLNYSPKVTSRGFTFHEHLDGVELIHMNGRIYDPLIGRFLSPDPVIQEVFNPQNLNGYSYVLNNPLSYIDPSGFFFLKVFRAIGRFFKNVGESIGWAAKKAGTWIWENKRLIAALAFTAVASVFCPGAGAPIAALFYSMAVGATAGLIASGGDLRAAAMGAVTAGAFSLVGTAFSSISHTLLGKMAKTVAHGFVGGGVSVASGGDFASGFLAAGVSEGFSALGIYDAIGASQSPNGWGGYVYNTAVAGIVGGTTSALSGGDFGNGAMTASFGRLFNDVAHHTEAGLGSVAFKVGKYVWKGARWAYGKIGSWWAKRQGTVVGAADHQMLQAGCFFFRCESVRITFWMPFVSWRKM